MEHYVLTVTPRSRAEIVIDELENLLLRNEIVFVDKERSTKALSLCFQPANVGKLCGELREAENKLRADLNLQPESERRKQRRLFAFDMDSTLIEAEVIDELAKLHGVGEQVAAITAAAMRGELEFKESFIRRMSFLKGLREEQALGLLKRVRITSGAAELFRRLKSAGCKTAVLSGGFSFFARHLQDQLGVDYACTNDLDVSDGALTGEVPGSIVDGRRKAEALKEVARAENISLEQSVVVGDGANDLPMMALAGVSVAYRAKLKVREAAMLRLSWSSLEDLLELVTI